MARVLVELSRSFAGPSPPLCRGSCLALLSPQVGAMAGSRVLRPPARRSVAANAQARPSPAAPAWHEKLSDELVAASSNTLAVVEHVAASLPGGFFGFVPSTPMPSAVSDADIVSEVADEYSVKARARHSRA